MLLLAAADGGDASEDDAESDGHVVEADHAFLEQALFFPLLSVRGNRAIDKVEGARTTSLSESVHIGANEQDEHEDPHEGAKDLGETSQRLDAVAKRSQNHEHHQGHTPNIQVVELLSNVVCSVHQICVIARRELPIASIRVVVSTAIVFSLWIVGLSEPV